MKFSKSIFPAAVSLCAVSFSAHLLLAQEEVPPKTPDAVSPPRVLELENDAVIEAGPDKLELRSGKARIAAPPGVVIAAPDEEIVIENKPRKAAPPAGVKPPQVGRKPKAPKDGNEAIERRLERLEQKLEALAENDRMFRKDHLALNEKQLAKIQKDIDRATREADIAVRRFNFQPGNEDNFVFEHKFAIAGDAKSQRKALEAQRKALEKQLEAINRRLDTLGDEEDADQEGGNGATIELKEEKSESKTSESPALPPDSAP